MTEFFHKKLSPLYYTTREGGTWFPWAGSFWVTRSQLLRLVRLKRPAVPLHLKMVHSMLFEIDAEKTKAKIFARWDCLNGWTQPVDLTGKGVL